MLMYALASQSGVTYSNFNSLSHQRSRDLRLTLALLISNFDDIEISNVKIQSKSQCQISGKWHIHDVSAGCACGVRTVRQKD